MRILYNISATLVALLISNMSFGAQQGVLMVVNSEPYSWLYVDGEKTEKQANKEGTVEIFLVSGMHEVQMKKFSSNSRDVVSQSRSHEVEVLPEKIVHLKLPPMPALPKEKEPKKGLLLVISNEKNSYIYVDGIKKEIVQSDEGKTRLFLHTGEHKVQVRKLSKDNKVISESAIKEVMIKPSDFVDVELPVRNKDSVKNETSKEEIMKLLDMKDIAEGCFKMGAVPGGKYENLIPDEKPNHKVCLGPYKISANEVNFALWSECVKEAYCTYSPKDTTGRSGRDNHPVVNVSWNDSQDFIEWLKNRLGGEWGLPTEAEWEYAARAGKKGSYFKELENMDNANCKSCSSEWAEKESTSPVGYYQANSWGLNDVHGNVWELVADDYIKDYYKDSPELNPLAQIEGDKSSIKVVRRGGSYKSTAVMSRFENRSSIQRSQRKPDIGFRVVLRFE